MSGEFKAPEPRPFPTGMITHTCPTCKKWSHHVHVSQGTPDPKWECAEHTGEPLCMICCDYASSSPLAEGWFCKKHKYRRELTPVEHSIEKSGAEHYETLEKKAKRLLSAKSAGIKKAYLQIGVLDNLHYCNAGSTYHLYEWKLRDQKKRKFIQKLFRNLVAPDASSYGSDRTAPLYPYPNISEKIEMNCDRSKSGRLGLPDNAVVFDTMYVVNAVRK